MNTIYQKHRDFMMNESLWPEFHSHLHTHCEIMYITEGVLDATLDGKSYEVKKHQAMFILPHQIHSFNSKCYNKGFVVFVSPLLLPKHAELMKTSILENPVIDLEKPSTVALCLNIIEYLFECFPGKTDPVTGIRSAAEDIVAKSDFAKALVDSFVSILLDKAVWKKKTVSAMDTARMVLDYCLSNYNKDISLYKVANAVGVAEHTVTRVFTDVLQCNFRKYINYLRLADVTRRLAESDERISDIAKGCGFDTMRTFNRVFVSEYGVTPSEYRKQNK